MFPGMNQRQMQQAMKRMGMTQQQLDAQEVIIRLADRDLVFRQPEIAKINMMGQETYQLIGEPEERLHESTPDITEEDIKTVQEQTGVNSTVARQAIEDANGDLAQAILGLQEDD